MAARIIDGKALAADIREALVDRVKQLSFAGHRPGLAVILVGDDPASAVYVRNKGVACEQVGIQSSIDRMPADTSEDELLKRIGELNRDDNVHGILVQTPLPSHVSSSRVLAAIAFEKDVDGLHATNAGLTLMGTPYFRSCTPYGVMKMLESIGTPIEGSQAVVLGRSNMVGKPMAMLLLAANATVTIAHSKTRALAAITRTADILIAAVGRRNLVTADMVKPGSVIIDVGTNRTAEGKLAGDVDFQNVRQVAGWISPVPGGVGPMTIAMLLTNTVEAAERRARQ
ncbi:MAG: bifunctional methylenetetrahydrofolate dehydrogenase/methenyltetrahydrofolate cyclohydrolase FolD [Pseudomonadota bacterium]|nr:bifunctional methylenetetrahydrofolate dehydrogenase/methenyltetrahydrofolate cyclohydrolase FolD [Pseudomonadota bacterium]